MDQRVRPSPRLEPLPPDPALQDQFEASKKSLGFVPNSLLIMQRKPKMVQAWAQMTAAVWDPESKVDRGFKRLLAHVASRAAGAHLRQFQPSHGRGHHLQQRSVGADLHVFFQHPLRRPGRRRWRRELAE